MAWFRRPAPVLSSFTSAPWRPGQACVHLSGVPHGNMGFSYIFGNGALYSQKIPVMKGLGSSCTLYNSLAICNVWDYVFMPGSGGYLLLMFMIKNTAYMSYLL